MVSVSIAEELRRHLAAVQFHVPVDDSAAAEPPTKTYGSVVWDILWICSFPQCSITGKFYCGF
jgi:hypothetical protein